MPFNAPPRLLAGEGLGGEGHFYEVLPTVTRRRIGMAFLSVLLAGLSLLGTVPPADAQLFGPSAPFAGSGPARRRVLAARRPSSAASGSTPTVTASRRPIRSTGSSPMPAAPTSTPCSFRSAAVATPSTPGASNPAPKIRPGARLRSARLPHRQGAQQRAAYPRFRPGSSP